MKKKILIVSYTFPPAAGIGGRRWVKFAKYLKKKGCVVKIISAKTKSKEISSWINDLETLKNDTYYISSNYPKWLTSQPDTFFKSTMYKLSLAYCKLLIKGNFYDRSSFFNKNLLKKAKELIHEYKLDNVICTVGPYKMARYILDLKKDFPKLNIIIDYRDPWTNYKSDFGYPAISEKRLNYDVKIEKEVLLLSDKITVVSPEMAEYFKVLEPSSIQKVVHLPNGFDKSDLLLDQKKNPFKFPDNNCKIILFAGSLYDDAFHVFEFLYKTVEELPIKIKSSLKFVFIGEITEKSKGYFINSENFIFLGKKNLKDTMTYINAADYCALFLIDELNYSFSTKFYEYVALKKPILTFARNHGNNARYIEKNSIGISFSFSDMKEKLTKLADKTNNSLSFYPPDFNIEQFNVEKISNIIFDILK